MLYQYCPFLCKTLNNNKFLYLALHSDSFFQLDHFHLRRSGGLFCFLKPKLVCLPIVAFPIDYGVHFSMPETEKVCFIMISGHLFNKIEFLLYFNCNYVVLLFTYLDFVVISCIYHVHNCVYSAAVPLPHTSKSWLQSNY